MNKFLFSFCTALLIVSCSNPNNDPQVVTQNFYTLLNKSEFEKAKELCSPSAVEYVEKLQKLCKNAGDTIPFKTMDIVKKESPVEGDIAIVSYKIGEFRNQIHLVFTDGEYKVIFTNDLKKLRILEKSAMDIFKEYKENSDLLWENYGGTRLRVDELIGGYRHNCKCIYGIPYNSKENSAPLDKSGIDAWGYSYFKVYHADKEVIMSGKGEDAILREEFKLVSDNPEFRSMVGKYQYDSREHERPATTKITLPSYFTFEGVLSGWKYDQITFKHCTITSEKQ